VGDLGGAGRSLNAFLSAQASLGAPGVAEEFDFLRWQLPGVGSGGTKWLLRPEVVESLVHLRQATRARGGSGDGGGGSGRSGNGGGSSGVGSDDAVGVGESSSGGGGGAGGRYAGDSWLWAGAATLEALERLARAPPPPPPGSRSSSSSKGGGGGQGLSCGFAALADAGSEDAELLDTTPSYFLSETLKYLYLLFDDENWVFGDDPPFVLTTEGHPFPVLPAARVDTTPGGDQCDGFHAIMRGANPSAGLGKPAAAKAKAVKAAAKAALGPGLTPGTPVALAADAFRSRFQQLFEALAGRAAAGAPAPPSPALSTAAAASAAALAPAADASAAAGAAVEAPAPSPGDATPVAAPPGSGGGGGGGGSGGGGGGGAAAEKRTFLTAAEALELKDLRVQLAALVTDTAARKGRRAGKLTGGEGSGSSGDGSGGDSGGDGNGTQSNGSAGGSGGVNDAVDTSGESGRRDPGLAGPEFASQVAFLNERLAKLERASELRKGWAFAWPFSGPSDGLPRKCPAPGFTGGFTGGFAAGAAAGAAPNPTAPARPPPGSALFSPAAARHAAPWDALPAYDPSYLPYTAD